MQKIIINALPQETRTAIVHDEQLVELSIEGHQNLRIVGNIYKGRVTKVLPGIEAAFIDIGLEKDAFLYALDVYDNLQAIEHDDEDETNGSVGERIAAQVTPDGDASASGKLTADSEVQVNIQELLKEGQEILVQVAKEPLGTKGARVTSHINLPGRYIVFMPTVQHVGVSRRIEEEEERERLKDLGTTLKNDNEGLIIRTIGEGKGPEEFQSDLNLLRNLWQRIQSDGEACSAPSLVYEDSDHIFRIMRDFFTPEVERIIVDNERHYQRSVEILDALDPAFTNRVRLHVKPTPIFEHFNIETEIERARRRKVWLRSGGYLVIEQTEALVTIDVNTGKYVGKRNLEETITQTNIEAAREIARQARLRNLGGIIIIDFIDMDDAENRARVLAELEQACSKDRTRTQIYPFTSLGLVEMTRKRTRPSLVRATSVRCPTCSGEGFIKSKNTVSYEIFRQLQKRLETTNFQEVLVRAHPDVAHYLRTEEFSFVKRLSEESRKSIAIQSDESLHLEQFDIVVL